MNNATHSAARQVGLDLLNATSRFDSPMGVVRGIGPVDLALIAFGVRGRRLLRAAFRLLDHHEPEAANALFRVMSEYLIVGRWLIRVGEEGMRAWALNDLRERLTVLREVLEMEKIDEQGRATLVAEILSTEEAIQRYGGAGAGLTKRAAVKGGESPTPRLQQMARKLGLGFAYSFSYRTQSQTDVHATPLAIDSVFSEASPSEPGPQILPIPRHALQGFDLYRVGGHLLLDILRPLSERVPELGWVVALDELQRRLLADDTNAQHE